ncbi:Retrovirus-related Pol polyprotein from transposon 297 [Vitis vinifera]|uniref:RNA-directed DNA polymerase n=1 Tax=Vitis vinifera TaxID=29760 RepID=A0A438IJ59_VITVI|nr:Retrovirus-related Pol polyprotein from transposon 297 [Vitis vinifera]
MYVEAVVNGKATKALVDTGATHNFVSEGEAKRLELQASKEGGWLKAVNSAAKPSHGVARGSCPKGFLLGEKEDHKIELEPGAKPPAIGAIPEWAPARIGRKLRRQLKELLDAGSSNHPRLPMARRSILERSAMGPYGCVLTTGHSTRARYFTKLDLRSGYYQVRIAEGDEPKTTCVTRYGSYEFLVMPFGLTNAPATFCTLMNKIFHPYLDKFVVVYLDDIVIYSNTLKEHVEHLRKVFKILRQNELYVKKEKCSFTKEEVSFLGHCIKDGKLMMDDSKVKAIQEWEPPTKVPQLRSFLDALDFAIGGVLMQDRHPIAFESRKLNDTERRYTVQEKEMTAIIHCLRTWRHYLLGSHFIVKTDNVATRYFQTQKKLSPKASSVARLPGRIRLHAGV